MKTTKLKKQAHREGPKRAAIYARVSTDEQAEKGYSLPTQLAACRKYAADHGFNNAAELVDDCSGSIPFAKRPQGQKLYELVEKDEIDAVIIFTHDRTARDERVLEYLLLKDYLHGNGVELHYTDTGLDPYSMEGNLVGYIKAHAAAAERLKIRERSTRGRDAKAKSGRVVMTGYPPYGYKREGLGSTARLVIHDPEARVVHLIFTWYVKGDGENGPVSLREIARRLDKQQEPAPHRSKRSSHYWGPSTVRWLLTNEIYAGRAHYGKSRMVNDERIFQPRDAWIPIDVPELAIVDRDTFDAAQIRGQRNIALSRRHQKREYLLTGFLRCAACNGAMCGHVGYTRTKGRVYVSQYYRCGTYWGKDKLRRCPIAYKSIMQQAVESLAWEWLKGLLSDEKKLEKGLKEMGKRAAGEIEPTRQRLEHVRCKIEENERQIKNLVGALKDETAETVVMALKNELKTLSGPLDGWRRECEVLEEDLKQKKFSPERLERIKQQAAAVRHKLSHATYQQKRNLMDETNFQAFFRIDETGKRWLDVRCGLSAKGKVIAFSPELMTNWRMRITRTDDSFQTAVSLAGTSRGLFHLGAQSYLQCFSF